MPNDLDKLIEGFGDASSQVREALSGIHEENFNNLIQLDKNLTCIFEEILKLEPDPEQRLARINFLSEWLQLNYSHQETLGSSLIATIRCDAKALHYIART